MSYCFRNLVGLERFLPWILVAVVCFVPMAFSQELPTLQLPPGCPNEARLGPDSPQDCLASIPEGWFSIGCGQVVGLSFSGRVGFRDRTGQFVPLPEASFSQGEARNGLLVGELRPLPELKVSRRGKFKRPVVLHFSRSLQKKNGLITWGAYREEILFVAQAPGCDDATVVFNESWSARDIVMRCPGPSGIGT
jgi:hypothetical protein